MPRTVLCVCVCVCVYVYDELFFEETDCVKFELVCFADRTQKLISTCNLHCISTARTLLEI